MRRKATMIIEETKKEISHDSFKSKPIFFSKEKKRESTENTNINFVTESEKFGKAMQPFLCDKLKSILIIKLIESVKQ